MSALLAPQTTPTRSPAPTLRPVPSAPTTRSNAPFVGLIAVVLGAGMAGAVFFNTVLEGQSRDLAALQRQATTVANQEAMLAADANQLRSPRVLALKATALGMVPNPHPVFVELPAGTIVGKPVAVTGRELPGMVGALP